MNRIKMDPVLKHAADDRLEHHGILGQRWGKRNGPPYPLEPSSRSSTEKKANGDKYTSSAEKAYGETSAVGGVGGGAAAEDEEEKEEWLKKWEEDRKKLLEKNPNYSLGSYDEFLGELMEIGIDPDSFSSSKLKKMYDQAKESVVKIRESKEPKTNNDVDKKENDRIGKKEYWDDVRTGSMRDPSKSDDLSTKVADSLAKTEIDVTYGTIPRWMNKVGKKKNEQKRIDDQFDKEKEKALRERTYEHQNDERLEELRKKKKITHSSEMLTHHGILGQRWGKKNGPPYPLEEGQKSSAEKKESRLKNYVNYRVDSAIANHEQKRLKRKEEREADRLTKKSEREQDRLEERERKKQKKQAKRDQKETRNLLKKPMDKMTDEELIQKINRIRLEKEIADLVKPSDASKAFSTPQANTQSSGRSGVNVNALSPTQILGRDYINGLNKDLGEYAKTGLSIVKLMDNIYQFKTKVSAPSTPSTS